MPVHLTAESIPPLTEIASRDSEKRVLMVSPTHYDVLYEINPHMQGNIGTVDKAAASAQWNALRETYQSLGFQCR